MNVLIRMVRGLVSGVRAVNRRYANPGIEMTPFVRLALVTLRVYLLVLIGLLVYKFAITVG